MKPSTYHLGLTGYPLGHSLSPKIHTTALHSAGLKGEYRLYPVAPDDTQALADLVNSLRSGKLDGLNVTIPYKQTVIPWLDDLTQSARSIGAVNTIFVKDGKLTGHNTDAPGFLGDLYRLLERWGRLPQKSVLILGAGGAARAVVAALLLDGWQVSLAVRVADLGQAHELARHHSPPHDRGGLIKCNSFSELSTCDISHLGLIVNATPLGMYPEIETCPWPEDLDFPPQVAVYDCVYNPRETLLVKRARATGLPAATGLGMLIEQAALAFETWTGRSVLREILFDAVGEPLNT